MALAALQAWQSQDWPSREIVILDDLADLSFPRGVDGPGVVYQAWHSHFSVGLKRNAACDFARGEFIVHFDSDDWSAPGRITDQVSRLIDTGLALTAYHTMKFTNADRTRWWIHRGTPRLAIGTSLCYRRDWWEKHRFAEVSVGEDSAFAAAAIRERQLVSVDARDLMYAVDHPGNTCQRFIEAYPSVWTELASSEAIR